ncbi:MAG: beta-L-arabinofuranosidase domain-containing protein [Blastocatellia bacterium]
MRIKRCLLLLLCLAATHARAQSVALKQPDRWQPLPVTKTAGLIGERLGVWRAQGLWRVANDASVLAVYERGIDRSFFDLYRRLIAENAKPSAPLFVYDGRDFRLLGKDEQRDFLDPLGGPMWMNRLMYYGEHAGKWLHAATLAYEAQPDPRLLAEMQSVVRRLVAAQKEDGYLGTYAAGERFYDPFNDLTKRSWDVWNERYVLYGLLAFEQFHPDPAVVRACVRLGDLLLGAFGPGGRNITETGQHQGMASATLLESIVKLYERTGESRFLRFAEHIVVSGEANPQTRIIAGLLAGKDVSEIANGKAYEMMANLLGYLELYRVKGERRLLDAALRAWESIRANHLYETGGAWGKGEHFAAPEAFDPANVVETCVTTTWIQLSLSLLRLTGEARFGDEAERAFFNQLLGAQAPDGLAWCTHPPNNGASRNYSTRLSCCLSSGPRGLELYARHLVGVSAGALSLNSYLPASVALRQAGMPVRRLTISGDYPFADEVEVRLQLDRPARFALDLRMPAGASGMTAIVAGRKQNLRRTPSGFLRLERSWRADDLVRLRFDFPLRAHFHAGSGRLLASDVEGEALDRARAQSARQWVAFTRGPLALARTVGNGEKPDGVEITAKSRNENGALWLEPAGRAETNLAYRLKGTDHILVPYYLAGSGGGGYQTLFPVKK